MNRKRFGETIGGLALAMVALAALATAAGASSKSHTASFSVFATGLLNPRGLTFGPDGRLYVAEGGAGGGQASLGNSDTAESDTEPCKQVPVPIGPVTGGRTARISTIDRNGHRTTVVDGLPSAMGPGGAAVGGVADVQFLGGRLYALTAGAGCSHGQSGTHNSLLRVDGHKATEVVDLSAYLMSHPVADTTFEKSDYEPDGTWYGLVRAHGALYATEPNHQVVERIDRHGRITRVLDMSAQSDARGRWIGPTAITKHHGDLYFGTLSPFPIELGNAAVYRLTANGRLSVVADDLTTVLGVAFDCRGRLYALESMRDLTIPFPTPNQIGSGRVVRIDHDGERTTVVDGLSFPSAMTFGPDGLFYISNFGFSSPTGAIVRADVGGGGCAGR